MRVAGAYFTFLRTAIDFFSTNRRSHSWYREREMNRRERRDRRGERKSRLEFYLYEYNLLLNGSYQKIGLKTPSFEDGFFPLFPLLSKTTNPS